MESGDHNVAISDQVFDDKEALLQAISKIVIAAMAKYSYRGEIPKRVAQEIVKALEEGGDNSFAARYQFLMAQLHGRELNSLFEYTTTFDDVSTTVNPTPPAGLGWRLNRDRGEAGITKYPPQEEGVDLLRVAYHWKRIRSESAFESPVLTGLADSMDVRRFTALMHDHYAQSGRERTNAITYTSLDKLLGETGVNREYGLNRIPAENPEMVDGVAFHQEATYMLMEFGCGTNAPIVQILTAFPGNTGEALFRMKQCTSSPTTIPGQTRWMRWDPELLLPISEVKLLERLRDF